MKKIIPIIFLGLILVVGFVVADQNCVPNMNTNEYYGTVYIGSNPLTGGDYTLVAVIGGGIVGAQPINYDGSYSIDVSPCPGVEGGKIEFFVGDAIADENGDYEYDGSAPILIELDLHLNKDPDTVCGNGQLTKGEECDDGNFEGGDGCSEICEIELGYECGWDSIEGSICTLLLYCGDSICNNGETCSTCAADCGACSTGGSSGGGGGSSGGGGGSFNPTTNTNTQTTNNTVDLSFEIETDESINLDSNENQKTTGPGITGGVIGFAKSGIGIGLIIGIIIILAGIGVMFMTRKSPKNG